MFSRKSVAAALCGAVLLGACSETSAPTEPTGAQPVATVRVSPGMATLPPGQTRQLSVALLDNAGRELTNRSVAWTSSAPAVADVGPGGMVTALGHGTATITASSEGRTGSAVISVAAPVATVTVTTPLDTLEAYDTPTLHAVLRDADGNVLTDRVVTWSTSDPSVATVDAATGVLTGVDRGTVTVTATSEGRTGSASRVVVIRYRSLTTGAAHACNLASGGIAWCWGLNTRDGRIGSDRLNDGEFSAVPVRVPGNLRFRQIATYSRATCGITLQGEAYCWGSNPWGVLGTGSTTPQQSHTPVAVTGGHTFTHIAAGSTHFCALNPAGKAWCWGANGSGELGRGNTTFSATPVAAVPELTFVSLTGGTEYVCGVTATGQSHCWGYDGFGNLGDGRKISFGNTHSLTPVKVTGGHSWKQLSAGQYHTCGVTTAGQAFCWGRNSGKLGNGVGTETSTPSAVAGNLPFRSISAGFSHSCGVMTDDAVYCWGSGANGQLGVVLANGSYVPVRAGSIRAADVSAANVAGGSGEYTCAISPDRLTTVCWGRNDVGQLGNGASTPANAANVSPSVVVGQRPL